MNKREANLYLCAMLETVCEASTSTLGGAPSGHMFAALTTRGVELEDYTLLLSIAIKSGLVTEDRSHLVRITDKGREIVAKIAAHDSANGGALSARATVAAAPPVAPSSARPPVAARVVAPPVAADDAPPGWRPFVSTKRAS